eukprot:TRINITY_DN4444_c0_g1_i1.p1 TRINITY_DN4444_c0_g1~~TRINITY_DN4444_c0_g1_i1.p1  ORF type:complete len:368 (-),score=44.50 TRINITY_DN4444_c0_g1_i1:439-1542(-)
MEKLYVTAAVNLMNEIPRARRALDDLNSKLEMLDALLNILLQLRPLLRDKGFNKFAKEGINPLLSAMQAYGSPGENTGLLGPSSRRLRAQKSPRTSSHKGSRKRQDSIAPRIVHTSGDSGSDLMLSGSFGGDESEFESTSGSFALPIFSEPGSPPFSRRGSSADMQKTKRSERLSQHQQQTVSAYISPTTPKVTLPYNFDAYLLLEKLLPCGCICLVGCGCVSRDQYIVNWLEVLAEVEDLQKRLMEAMPYDFLEDIKHLATIFEPELVSSYCQLLDAFPPLLEKADRKVRRLLRITKAGVSSPDIPALTRAATALARVQDNFQRKTEVLLGTHMGLIDFVNEVLDFHEKYSMERYQDLKNKKGTSV